MIQLCIYFFACFLFAIIFNKLIGNDALLFKIYKHTSSTINIFIKERVLDSSRNFTYSFKILAAYTRYFLCIFHSYLTHLHLSKWSSKNQMRITRI
nr:hypothetical protein [uncultured bacterium]